MLTRKQEMKDILVAIKSVKFRAVNAQRMGMKAEYERLMGDLIALDVCLVGAVDRFIEEEEQVENLKGLRVVG